MDQSSEVDRAEVPRTVSVRVPSCGSDGTGTGPAGGEPVATETQDLSTGAPTADAVPVAVLRAPRGSVRSRKRRSPDIQQAILGRQITATELVTRYLERIKAYNGTCVNEPNGILGPISTIPHAGKLNALMTLNLRPATRLAWGFDSRKARSQTDLVDDDPNMPDALEVAASLDAQFAKTGKLVGPLHGVVLAIKDQYNTFDMRTTAGADAFYANDRPPRDATFIKRLRAAGAILIAKVEHGRVRRRRNHRVRAARGAAPCATRTIPSEAPAPRAAAPAWRWPPISSRARSAKSPAPRCASPPRTTTRSASRRRASS